jgi:putative membrane protein
MDGRTKCSQAEQELVMKLNTKKLWLFTAAVALTPISLAAQYPPLAGTTQSAPSSATPSVLGVNPAQGATDLSGNGGSATDPQLMRDKIFVHKATDGGYAQSQFGQLAAAKASSEDVKRFGKHVVEDNVAMAEALKPLAEEMGVRQATKLSKGQREEFDKLSGLSGMDFDKEYLAYAVKDYQKDLQQFHAAMSDTNNPALKETAAKGELMISRHLRWAGKLATANGVSIPAPPQ